MNEPEQKPSGGLLDPEHTHTQIESLPNAESGAGVEAASTTTAAKNSEDSSTAPEPKATLPAVGDEPEPTSAGVAQSQKPVAESASPENEAEAARAGQARPQDPESADDVLTKTLPENLPSGSANAEADARVLAASRRRTRRSFLVGGVAAAGAYGFYHWLDAGPHRDEVPALLDRTYNANAAVSRAVFRDRALAPTYPVSRAEALRVNGIFGLKKTLKPESWRLQLVGSRDDAHHPRYVRDVTTWIYQYEGNSHDDAGHDSKTDPNKQTSTKMAPAQALERAQADENADGDLKQTGSAQPFNRETGRKRRGLEEAGESDSTLRAGTPGLLLTFDDFLPQLKRYEMVTQFKCIEGWSQIVHWAGVRFADFLELFPPALVNGREPRYVYLETPDGDYYVGYDLHVCRHPQTLLVTEMMGVPLTPSHGAPLRLHAPTKYGYKQIKRIGLIAYTDTKPDDYWTKLGYDWYAGL